MPELWTHCDKGGEYEKRPHARDGYVLMAELSTGKVIEVELFELERHWWRVPTMVGGHCAC